MPHSSPEASPLHRGWAGRRAGRPGQGSQQLGEHRGEEEPACPPGVGWGHRSGQSSPSAPMLAPGQAGNGDKTKPPCSTRTAGPASQARRPGQGEGGPPSRLVPECPHLPLFPPTPRVTSALHTLHSPPHGSASSEFASSPSPTLGCFSLTCEAGEGRGEGVCPWASATPASAAGHPWPPDSRGGIAGRAVPAHDPGPPGQTAGVGHQRGGGAAGRAGGLVGPAQPLPSLPPSRAPHQPSHRPQ